MISSAMLSVGKVVTAAVRNRRTGQAVQANPNADQGAGALYEKSVNYLAGRVVASDV